MGEEVCGSCEREEVWRECLWDVWGRVCGVGESVGLCGVWERVWKGVCGLEGRL